MQVRRDPDGDMTHERSLDRMHVKPFFREWWFCLVSADTRADSWLRRMTLVAATVSWFSLNSPVFFSIAGRPFWTIQIGTLIATMVISIYMGITAGMAFMKWRSRGVS